MIETKLFEVRDRATTISVIAIKMCAVRYSWKDTIEQAEQERFLLHRVGYNPDEPAMILFANLADEKFYYHPEQHSMHDARTMVTAHQYIVDRWSSLVSGQVIDVEYILGETNEPKQSEHVHNRLF